MTKAYKMGRKSESAMADPKYKFQAVKDSLTTDNGNAGANSVPPHCPAYPSKSETA